MKNPVIVGVASASRIWLNNFSRLQILNHSSFSEAVMARPQHVPLITVSNHISTVDDPVMWGGLLTNRMICELIERDRMRHVPAAKEIVFTNFLFHWFFSTGQAIPIERGKGVYQPGMDEALNRVNKGGWLHLFPEGKVIPSFDDYKIGRLKWGIGRLIMEAKVPPLILPIILKGFDVMKPLDKLPRPYRQIAIAVGEVEDSNHYLKSTNHLTNLDTRRSAITEMIQNSLNKVILS